MLVVLYTRQAHYLMIVQAHTLTMIQLNVTADSCHCEQKLSGLGAMVNDHRVVRCKLEDRGLFCCLPSLDFLYFSNPRFPGASKCCDSDNTQPPEAVLDGDCVLHCMDSIKRWAVLMGIAVNRSLKAHFSISAGFQESSKNCYNTVQH